MPASPAATAPRWTWLFGPGVGADTHAAMAHSGAQVLILDWEDFTPPALRPAARDSVATVLAQWRAQGAATCVRINALAQDGPEDLTAAMPQAPDIIAYPMAERAEDIAALDEALSRWEQRLGLPAGQTEILPVCETARGVLDVRDLAAASVRVRAALLGTEDLAADLGAPRSIAGIELAHARSHFLMACRAAGITPIDAPTTWADPELARQETLAAMQLGYPCKSLVRVEHVAPVLACLRPSAQEIERLRARIYGFEAARAQGQERALVDGLWVEVPSYRAALRRLAEAGLA